MEIINLKTENTNLGQDNCDKLVITGLKQGVKNPNRVNVFVNSKYEFSLDVTQVVDFKIKAGMEISPEQLLEFKKASEFGKLYQRALEWVLVRPRSMRETRDYLARKVRMSSSGRSSCPSLRGSSLRPRSDCGCLSEDISDLPDKIITRLSSHGHLNDFEFAKWYVENRFVKKGVSQKRLKMELMKKGVSLEIVDEVLNGSERNDKDEILKIIAKKRAKYDDEKLIAYLCRQGFSYQLVQDLVRSYEMD